MLRLIASIVLACALCVPQPTLAAGPGGPAVSRISPGVYATPQLLLVVVEGEPSGVFVAFFSQPQQVQALDLNNLPVEGAISAFFRFGENNEPSYTSVVFAGDERRLRTTLFARFLNPMNASQVLGEVRIAGGLFTVSGSGENPPFMAFMGMPGTPLLNTQDQMLRMLVEPTPTDKLSVAYDFRQPASGQGFPTIQIGNAIMRQGMGLGTSPEQASNPCLSKNAVLLPRATVRDLQKLPEDERILKMTEYMKGSPARFFASLIQLQTTASKITALDPTKLELVLVDLLSADKRAVCVWEKKPLS